VRSGSTYCYLTAGHCPDVASTWYEDSAQTVLAGTNARGSFPGNDYGIMNVASPGYGECWLNTGSVQDITMSRNAYVNQSVRRNGSTTGLRSGRVTALIATVNYAEGGDSGGSLLAGSTALGLTSGGSGNCRAGGTTSASRSSRHSRPTACRSTDSRARLGACSGRAVGLDPTTTPLC
jgi:streptogrisin D